LQRLCDANDWVLAEKDSFVAQDVNVHRIFALTGKAGSAAQ